MTGDFYEVSEGVVNETEQQIVSPFDKSIFPNILAQMEMLDVPVVKQSVLKVRVLRLSGPVRFEVRSRQYRMLQLLKACQVLGWALKVKRLFDVSGLRPYVISCHFEIQPYSGMVLMLDVRYIRVLGFVRLSRTASAKSLNRLMSYSGFSILRSCFRRSSGLSLG